MTTLFLGRKVGDWIAIERALETYRIKDAAELEKVLARKSPPKLMKAEARVLRKLLQRER